MAPEKEAGFGYDRLVAVALSALAVVLAFVAVLYTRSGREARVAGAPSAVDFSLAAERVMPSLVKVENQTLAGHPPIPAFGAPGEIAQVREGAGFFIDKKGLILTNFHVVDGAQALKVITPQRRAYDAELIGADALTDLALLRIRPDFEVVPALLGDSDRLKVGQWVLALGNPLGLEFFTSAGIVSGFGPPGRGYIGFYDFVQIDVNIKPGNSGGPLVDYDGRVVGVNSAYLGPGSGIGFAIPINRARQIIPILEREGKVSRGFLGVLGQPLTPGLAERLGLKGTSGSLISGVMDGSPAEAAGLSQGDVVVAFDGEPVGDDRDLQERINTAPANAKVTLDVVRGGREMRVPVALGELKAHSIITQRVIKQCGITLQELDPKMASRIGLTGMGGLLVLKVIPGCPSFEAGLAFGDVILRVEGKEVATIGDFYRAYSEVPSGGQVLIEIFRGGRPHLLTMRQEG